MAAGPAVDSARANLASTFVNAFVNAGFGQDKLVTATSEDEKVGRGAPAPARGQRLSGAAGFALTSVPLPRLGLAWQASTR